MKQSLTEGFVPQLSKDSMCQNIFNFPILERTLFETGNPKALRMYCRFHIEKLILSHSRKMDLLEEEIYSNISQAVEQFREESIQMVSDAFKHFHKDRESE